MELTMILNIVQILAYVVLGGLTLYFKYNTKLNSRVAEFIKDAEQAFEDYTNSGNEKFNWVIDKLYALIPAPLNLIFTRDMIGGIVQRTFDEIEEYAKTQLDKAVDKVVE